MMRTLGLILALALVAPFSMARADESCGDDGTVCDSDEKCCEHIIAMFSEDHSIAPPYVQGQCVPKQQKCSDFWCGNRHCRSGIFVSPTVCCINTPEQGSIPEYSCAASELSCPGNTRQLTIRESQPNRSLRRG